jgi:hypothetical protein
MQIRHIFLGLVALFSIGFIVVPKQVKEELRNLGGTILYPHSGGTGIGSATTSDIGSLMMVSSSNPLVYKFAPTSSLGFGSGIVESGTSGQFPYYAATGTTLTPTSSLFILSNGSVGIGTTTPQARLSIQGFDGLNPFDIASSTGSSLFRILTNGNVGIGTNAPAQLFDIWASGATRFNVRTDGVVNVSNEVRNGSMTQTTAGLRWGSPGSFMQIGGVNGAGSVGNSAGAEIDVYGNLSATTPGALLFRTGSAAVNQQALTMIMSASNTVGIGTTTPLSTLTIQGGTSTNPFDVASSTGSSLLRVLTNGNVGIGTAAPTALLDVSGTTGGSTAITTNASMQAFNFRASNSFYFFNSNLIMSAGTPFNDTGASYNFTDSSGVIGRQIRASSLFISTSTNSNANGVLINTTSISVNTNTIFATLGVQGSGARNPFEIVSSSGSSMFKVWTNGYITGNFVNTGLVTTYTTTGNITAAELCDSKVLKGELGGAETLTLPSTTTLFSTCLRTDGDSITLKLFNNSPVLNNMTINAGAGGTLYSIAGEGILSAGQAGYLDITRISSTAYIGLISSRDPL